MDRDELLRRFQTVRGLTERLMAPLSAEDYRVQSMPDVSPPYWNLGHTSWFFAANVLRAFGAFESPPGFDYVFNSYYEGLGPRLPRADRGKVAQPRTAAVREYRQAVDHAVIELLIACPPGRLTELANLVTIALQHEQQHQELFLTEIQHIRWSAPADQRMPYAPRRPRVHRDGPASPLRATSFAGGATTLGHTDPGFCWDNELPAHRVQVPDFALGDRLVTNAEWQAFIDDGGYRSPLLWLSNGWLAVQQHGWQAPLYWQRDAKRWQRWSLHGLDDLDPDAPVCHVSFYEAEAFARWYGTQFTDWKQARLPRESEWEHAARSSGFDAARGNLLGDDLDATLFDVAPAAACTGLRQLAGDAWEWTSSHYEPYPGYRPFAGALMEYNGKFMDNQRVLRGGSFATPRAQARLGYRNFWPGDTRFQITSVRLLRDE